MRLRKKLLLGAYLIIASVRDTNAPRAPIGLPAANNAWREATLGMEFIAKR